jgi:hypothetical protein
VGPPPAGSGGPGGKGSGGWWRPGTKAPRGPAGPPPWGP